MERLSTNTPDKPVGTTPTAIQFDDLSCATQARPLPDRYLPRLLSVSEVLATLSIGRTSFYEMVAEGKLRPVKIGRRTMIVAAELEAFIVNLPRGGVR